MVTDLLGVKFVPVIVTVPPPIRTVLGEALRAALDDEVGHGFEVGVGDGLGLGFGLGFGLGLEVPDVGLAVGLDPGLGLLPGVGVVPGLPQPDGEGLAEGVGLGRVPGATIRSGFCSGQDPLQHMVTLCMPLASANGMTIPWLTGPVSSA